MSSLRPSWWRQVHSALLNPTRTLPTPTQNAYIGFCMGEGHHVSTSSPPLLNYYYYCFVFLFLFAWFVYRFWSRFDIADQSSFDSFSEVIVVLFLFVFFARCSDDSLCSVIFVLVGSVIVSLASLSFLSSLGDTTPERYLTRGAILSKSFWGACFFWQGFASFFIWIVSFFKEVRGTWFCPYGLFPGSY